MKYYYIRKHYEAAETNNNFRGEVEDYYYGKGEQTVIPNCLPNIEAYAYTTKAGAMKGFKSAQYYADKETADGHWNVTVELVEVIA